MGFEERPAVAEKVRFEGRPRGRHQRFLRRPRPDPIYLTIAAAGSAEVVERHLPLGPWGESLRPDGHGADRALPRSLFRLP